MQTDEYFNNECIKLTVPSKAALPPIYETLQLSFLYCRHLPRIPGHCNNEINLVADSDAREQFRLGRKAHRHGGPFDRRYRLMGEGYFARWGHRRIWS